MHNYFLELARWVFIGFLLVFSLVAKAQVAKLEANLGACFPSQRFANSAKTGFGGDLNLKLKFNNTVSAGVLVGFHKFDPIEPAFSTIRILPTVAFLDFYLSEGRVRPYIGEDIGIYTQFITTAVGTKSNKSFLGFAHHFGVSIRLAPHISLNLDAKYHAINPFRSRGEGSVNYIGVNGGIEYAFY